MREEKQILPLDLFSDMVRVTKISLKDFLN